MTGGLTLVLLPLAYVYRRAAGLETSEYIVSFSAFYAAYLINDPHFSVSYLLFYKRAKARLFGQEFQGAQRVRYLVAGLLVPLVLSGWIAFALITQSAQVLGAMVQLMYLLVGWHYVKQGFGVLSVISARHGVSFTLLERRILLAHCLSGWAYAWASPAEKGREYEETGVVYSAISHPPGLETTSLVLLVLSSGAVVYAILRRALRKEAFPPWAASCGFLMSIWLWTIYSQVDPLMIYVIPALHSLQYWYFVYLLKRNQTRGEFEWAHQGDQLPSLSPKLFNGATTFGGYAARRMGLFFVSAVALAWLFFHGIPETLDQNFVATTAAMGLEPDVAAHGLGTTPYVAAFATFINIHHYFIDHVIWRRENPETRYLRDE